MRRALAISFRFLGSRRSDGALSVITWVALLGVILGVAALVVAMAVMNGYQANLLQAMAGSLPHISIHPASREGFPDLQKLAAELEQAVRPRSVSPFTMEEGLVRAGVGRQWR